MSPPPRRLAAPPPRPVPINALWQELVLNKTFEVVDHAQVVDAKRSLSTMLRDFTQTNNTDLTADQIDGLLQSGEAMDLLSRRYEEEVQKPMTSMIMNGSLVQMMLIQTQFLKKEVMVSMERVDTLIKANQVNMELMATVPAFMMASVVAMCGGAVYRLLFKRQSRRRVRDEAEQILADIEQILNLVAGGDETIPLAARCGVAFTIMAFGVMSTGMVHWITKPYILEMSLNRPAMAPTADGAAPTAAQAAGRGDKTIVTAVTCTLPGAAARPPSAALVRSPPPRPPSLGTSARVAAGAPQRMDAGASGRRADAPPPPPGASASGASAAAYPTSSASSASFPGSSARATARGSVNSREAGHRRRAGSGSSTSSSVTSSASRRSAGVGGGGMLGQIGLPSFLVQRRLTAGELRAARDRGQGNYQVGHNLTSVVSDPRAKAEADDPAPDVDAGPPLPEVHMAEFATFLQTVSRSHRRYLANHGGWGMKLYLEDASAMSDLAVGRLPGVAVLSIGAVMLLPWLVLAVYPRRTTGEAWDLSAHTPVVPPASTASETAEPPEDRPAGSP